MFIRQVVGENCEIGNWTRTDDISSGSFGCTELMGQNIIRGTDRTITEANVGPEAPDGRVESAILTKFEKYLIFVARSISTSPIEINLLKSYGTIRSMNYR